MANLSNIAYDAGVNVSPIVPAMLNIQKILQEERVSQSPAAATSESMATSESSGLQTIETRFGVVSVNTAEPIVFARGLLGMPERQRFALTDFPHKRFEQFKLLQSLEDASLSFITLPLELYPELILLEDLQRASEDVGIAYEDLAVLLIVTVHRSPADVSKVHISVNTRAPLLVDASTRQALQYVFPHDRYSVQQMMSEPTA